MFSNFRVVLELKKIVPYFTNLEQNMCQNPTIHLLREQKISGSGGGGVLFGRLNWVPKGGVLFGGVR